MPLRQRQKIQEVLPAKGKDRADSLNGSQVSPWLSDEVALPYVMFTRHPTPYFSRVDFFCVKLFS